MTDPRADPEYLTAVALLDACAFGEEAELGEGPAPGEGFVPAHILLLRDALRLAEGEERTRRAARSLASGD